MSQIYKAGVGGTPSVPTSITTDQTDTVTASIPVFGGTVIPVANTLRVTGLNGIQTFQPTLINGTLEIGYNGGRVTTTDATPTTIMTITPTDNSAQTYQFILIGFDALNNVCYGGQLIGVARKAAGVVTVLSTPDRFFDADAALGAASFNLVASGADVLVQVTGVALTTIDWACINAAGVVSAT